MSLKSGYCTLLSQMVTTKSRLTNLSAAGLLLALGVLGSLPVSAFGQGANVDGITLSVSPDSVDESAGTATLTVSVTLKSAHSVSTTIQIYVEPETATEGTDYTTGRDASLVLSAGQTKGTAKLTLTPVDDEVYEGNETVRVDGRGVQFPYGFGNGPTVILDATAAEVTITDNDDPPTVSVSYASATYRATEGGSAATVTVKLSANPHPSPIALNR